MRTVPLALLLALVAASPRPAPGQEEMTDRTQAAIEKGLKHITTRQLRNGSYDGSTPVATTALCGLAMLASGSTHDRGPYADNLKRATEFLCRSTGRNGHISEANSGMGGGSAMHGQGYATMFLAEIVGTITDKEVEERVREKLHLAVRCIEGCQNQWGGWNSTPDKNAGDDGSGAVAVMQILALRASKNCGIEVSQPVIDKAIKYILKITSDAGWTAYNIHSQGTQSSATTGAGLSILNALGLQETTKLKKGIANLMKSAPFLKGPGDQGWQGWYFYTVFHATLAIFQYGGEEWKKWWPAVRDDLLRQQTAGGEWAGSYGSYGPLWTAFAVLTLELPYRYLPLFAEGGRGAEGR